MINLRSDGLTETLLKIQALQDIPYSLKTVTDISKAIWSGNIFVTSRTPLPLKMKAIRSFKMSGTNNNSEDLNLQRSIYEQCLEK
jgi:hypothetical protein